MMMALTQICRARFLFERRADPKNFSSMPFTSSKGEIWIILFPDVKKRSSTRGGDGFNFLLPLSGWITKSFPLCGMTKNKIKSYRDVADEMTGTKLCNELRTPC